MIAMISRKDILKKSLISKLGSVNAQLIGSEWIHTRGDDFAPTGVTKPLTDLHHAIV